MRACVRAWQLASLRRGVLAVRPYLLYRHWAFHLALYELYEASHRHRAPLLPTPQHGRAAPLPHAPPAPAATTPEAAAAASGSSGGRAERQWAEAVKDSIIDSVCQGVCACASV